MYYELFSDGTITRLPDNTSIPHGLPSGITPKVLLFAPFNRVLLGHVTLSGYDRWLWGKLHSSEWKEMQLYEESRLRLPMPWKAIHLEGKAVSSLRKGLLGQIAPPGNHQVALNMLRETQRHTPGFVIFEALDDQESLWEYIIRDPKLRAGYWGFRLASLWGGSSMIERVSLWLRIARPLYDASLSRPRMWGFLSSPFDPVSIRQIEELGFKKGSVAQCRIKSSCFGIFLGVPHSICLRATKLSGDSSRCFAHIHASVSSKKNMESGSRRTPAFSQRNLPFFLGVSRCFGCRSSFRFVSWGNIGSL